MKSPESLTHLPERQKETLSFENVFEHFDREKIKQTVTEVESNPDKKKLFRDSARILYQSIDKKSSDPDRRYELMDGESLGAFYYFENHFFTHGDGRDVLAHSHDLRKKENIPTAYRFYNIGNFVMYSEHLRQDLGKIFYEENIEQFRNLYDLVYDCLRFSNAPQDKLVRFAERSISLLDEYSEQTDNVLIRLMSEKLRNLCQYVIDNPEEIPDPVKEYGPNPPLNAEQNAWSVKLLKQSYYAGMEGQKIFEEAKKQFIKHNPLATEGDVGITLSIDFREQIEKHLGISLNNLPEELRYRAQYYILEFFKNKKLDELPQYKYLFNEGNTEKDKLNRLTCSLALEGREIAASDLLAINEKLTPEVAQRVFDKYAEIANLIIENKAELLRDFFIDEPEKLIDPTEEILKRAQAIIRNLANKADQNAEAVESVLDNIKKETELFLSIFKSWYKDNPEATNFEKVKGLDFRYTTADNLSEADVDGMCQLIDSVYEKKGYTKEQRENLIKGVRERISKGKNSKWYILKKDKEIISMVGFDETDEGNLFAHSFATQPDAQGAAIGSVMEKQSVNIEAASGRTIEADVVIDKEVVPHYIKQGWVIYDTDMHPKTKNENLLIRLNNEERSRLESASEEVLPDAQVINLFTEGNYGSMSDSELLTRDQFILQFTNPLQRKDHERFSTFTEQGFVIPRVTLSPDKKTAYYLFVKVEDNTEKANQKTTETTEA